MLHHAHSRLVSRASRCEQASELLRAAFAQRPSQPPCRAGVRPARALRTTAQAQRQITLSTSTTVPDSSEYNLSGLNGLSTCGTSGLDQGTFTVSSYQPVQYTVQEAPGLLNPENKTLLRGVLPNSFPSTLGPEPLSTQGLRRFIVIDEVVDEIYGGQLRQYLNHHGIVYKILALPTCEENKDFALVERIAEALEDFKLNRRQEPIIVIGGGVCLDVTGLAANLYRRNTPVIKVPTTLMGVVDASIGIKTAVNFHNKKNKLGTYCPPLGVFYDLSFLHTLEARHMSNGSAEILKMACIKDRELFQLLSTHAKELIASKYQGGAACTVIRRSIQGMLEELEYNLWEHILVRLVDYGHTFSPEIEMAALQSNNMLLHGEAVNIDMALTTQLSYQRGLLSSTERDQVFNVMRAFNLPLCHDVCNVDMLIKALDDMTRARDGFQRTPLMSGIGSATFVDDIKREEVAAALAVIQHMQRSRVTSSGVAAANNVVIYKPHTAAAPAPAVATTRVLEMAPANGECVMSDAAPSNCTNMACA